MQQCCWRWNHSFGDFLRAHIGLYKAKTSRFLLLLQDMCYPQPISICAVKTMATPNAFILADMGVSWVTANLSKPLTICRKKLMQPVRAGQTRSGSWLADTIRLFKPTRHSSAAPLRINPSLCINLALLKFKAKSQESAIYYWKNLWTAWKQAAEHLALRMHPNRNFVKH